MNAAEVVDVLTVVAALDRRTVGDSDVIAWREIIGDLPVGLALEAVRGHFRERPGVWLEPGHIVERVRAKRRDEFDRSELDDGERLSYEERCDFKAGYPVSGIDDREDGKPIRIEDTYTAKRHQAHRERMGRVLTKFGASPDELVAAQYVNRVVNNPLDVTCPWCHATPGNPCVIPLTREVLRKIRAHPQRVDALAQRQNHLAPESPPDSLASATYPRRAGSSAHGATRRQYGHAGRAYRTCLAARSGAEAVTANEIVWGIDDPKAPICTGCGVYPIARMDSGLCAACIGRELLGVGSRAEHTAAIRAEYDKAEKRKRADRLTYEGNTP